jgi:hypothetical protein
MFSSFKTVGLLQVIHQPLYRPKQIRAGKYAVGRKIGLETVKKTNRLFVFRKITKLLKSYCFLKYKTM